MHRARFPWRTFLATTTGCRGRCDSTYTGTASSADGGVTAGGCTVGQGLTGVSTLALGSFLALASILAGSAATLKYITWRAEREA